MKTHGKVRIIPRALVSFGAPSHGEVLDGYCLSPPALVLVYLACAAASSPFIAPLGRLEGLSRDGERYLATASILDPDGPMNSRPRHLRQNGGEGVNVVSTRPVLFRSGQNLLNV